MEKETHQYIISESFASKMKIPAMFTAVILRESRLAVYIYGHGLMLHSDVQIDSWMPKAVIKQTLMTSEQIVVPESHKMLQQSTDALDAFKSAMNTNENQTNTLNTTVSMPQKVKAEKTVILAETKDSTPVCLIKFPYNMEDLDRIRSLKDRKFNPDGKWWTSPVTVDNLQHLSDWGFILDNELKSILNRSKVTVEQLSVLPEELNIPGLKMELFPFQKIGVRFIEAKGGRALIADEMGLGKTIQALAYLQLHPELRPAVIVVPASLKLNWLKEANMWMPNPNADVVSSTTPYVVDGDIVIINYDVLSYWVPTLISWKPQVLIMDEIHSIKNNAAKRTKAVKSLAKTISHIIGLSGTPIINRPVEAYNAISLIDPTIFGSYWSYVHRYCGAKRGRFGMEVNGATNLPELHQKLTDSIMLRRLKKDVLKDLPDKMYSYVPIELDNRQEYLSAQRDFIQFVLSTKGQAAAVKASNARVLAEIEGLKQLSVKGKMAEVLTWIEDFLEADGKLVVFAVHKFVIEALTERFRTICVKIDGSVSQQDRQLAVDRFQEDKNIRLFIGNIQAAGVGLTLTAASSVAFIELPWTPGQLAQAADRVHRIGQKNAVTVYYLLGTNTIEEKIAKLLDSKQIVLDAVLDGQETAPSSLLSALISEYTET